MGYKRYYCNYTGIYSRPFISCQTPGFFMTHSRMCYLRVQGTGQYRPSPIARRHLPLAPALHMGMLPRRSSNWLPSSIWLRIDRGRDS